jgi:hypothetical protein
MTREEKIDLLRWRHVQRALARLSPAGEALERARRYAMAPIINACIRQRVPPKQRGNGAIGLRFYSPRPEETSYEHTFKPLRSLPTSMDKWNRFVTVDNTRLVRLKPSLMSSQRYHLEVKFPAGWGLALIFDSGQWTRIIEAMEPLFASQDPVEIYKAAQRAIYGKDFFEQTAYKEWA